jgi:hypothetical protein
VSKAVARQHTSKQTLCAHTYLHARRERGCEGGGSGAAW